MPTIFGRLAPRPLAHVAAGEAAAGLQARPCLERGRRAASSGRRRAAQARAALSYDGWAYTVGDFAVGVGKATVRPGDELRGLMVEVEYLPAQLPHLAAAALQARAAAPRAARPGPRSACRPGAERDAHWERRRAARPTGPPRLPVQHARRADASSLCRSLTLVLRAALCACTHSAAFERPSNACVVSNMKGVRPGKHWCAAAA